jgi:hypothetical protein
MAYRLLFAYAFVRPESEQNSSHPTFPRSAIEAKSQSYDLRRLPTSSPVGPASVGLSFPVKDIFELGKGDYLAERWLTLAERAAKTQ